jgi:hypothetical protein
MTPQDNQSGSGHARARLWLCIVWSMAPIGIAHAPAVAEYSNGTTRDRQPAAVLTPGHGHLLLPRRDGTQGAPRQSDLAALHDRIMTIRDVSVLSGMLDSRVDAAIEEPVSHARIGLAALRLYQITGEKSHYERSRRSLDRARDALGATAWSHYFDALTLAYSPGLGFGMGKLIETGRSLAQEFGIGARAKAQRAVERAIAADSNFVQAAILQGELALFANDHREILHARSVLAALVAGAPSSNEALVTLSRLSLALGEHDHARELASRVVERDSSPRALHAMAVAMLRSPGSEEQGAEAFRALVDRLTPEDAIRLWGELGLIADTAEARQWREAAIAGRKQILRDFWTMRAAMSAVGTPEALAEHYRRLAVAIDSFPRISDGRQPSTGTLLRDRDPAPLDERGIVYLRHGPPSLRITSAGQLAHPGCGRSGPAIYNESWLYDQLDGTPRLIHFLRCLEFPDWLVPYSTPCAPPGRAANPMQGGRRWEQAITYTLDRQAFDDDATLCGRFTPERTREFALNRLRTDSHLPRFDHTLPFALDLLAFRGIDGLTDLSSPIAVLADSLRPDTLADGQLAYRLEASAFLVDTIAGTIVRADTDAVFATPRAPGRGELVVAHVNLSSPPTDDALYRLVVREAADARSGRVHGTHIRVPSYDGDTLMVSSVVLAIAGEGGNWRRGDTQLTLMPIGEFDGDAFRVFYEVYNLPLDAPFRTEIIVERAPGELDRLIGQPIMPGERPLIQLAFDGIADPDENGVIQELRSVETGLQQGRYRITVRVTDLTTQRTATSQRSFLMTSGSR